MSANIGTHQNLFDYNGTSMLDTDLSPINSRQTKLNGHGVVAKPNSNFPLVCPSCKGTGRLPKGMEQELVALIPYKDNRLKPRPVWPYITVAVGLLSLTLFTGGALLFFMYPRQVAASTFDAVATTPNDSFVVTSRLMNMSLNASVFVNNSNFFSISVLNLNITVFHYDIIVGTYKEKEFSVGSFEHKLVQTVFNLTFKGTDMIKVRNNCYGEDYTHMVILTFLVSSSYSYLSHVSATTDTDWMYISCNYNMRDNAITVDNSVDNPDTWVYNEGGGQNGNCDC
ncbi:putative membrane protein [Oopsacas minuta]|uniref:Membrane protein n=1 Tax=Oopsacas minuta TaxID=111878 RepID=A0AAV7JRX8_9METZ|nr:putative membrane protein [Oopsacas minuta]